MSFILDALRKSEHQRQKNTAPSIADNIIQPKQKKRSPWLILAIILLAVNGVLIITLWLRSEPVEQQVAAQQTSQQPRQAPTRTSNRQQAPVSIAENVQVESAAEPDTTPSLTSSAVQIPNGTSSNLPSLETLQLQGVLTLPPMRVDIHVYSNLPAERFVFINMQKQREGSQLNEGPTVDTITPDGVILTWQGRRFIMSKD